MFGQKMTYLLFKHRVGFGPLLNGMAKKLCFFAFYRYIWKNWWFRIGSVFLGGLKTSPHACEESRKNKLIIKCECQKISYTFFLSHIFSFFICRKQEYEKRFQKLRNHVLRWHSGRKSASFWWMHSGRKYLIQTSSTTFFSK